MIPRTPGQIPFAHLQGNPPQGMGMPGGPMGTPMMAHAPVMTGHPQGQMVTPQMQQASRSLAVFVYEILTASAVPAGDT